MAASIAGDVAGQTVAGLALTDFDYELPTDRIAQTPVEPRDASRMLHLARDGSVRDHRFADLPLLLRRGDLLIANDTRVRAARLRGRRDDGAEAEVLLLDRLGGARFSALVRPGRRLHAGATVAVGRELLVTVLGPAPGHPGAREVAVTAVAGAGDAGVDDAIARTGEVPLPPYISTPLGDPARYQTIYASGDPGSAAAPTAGLHFTSAVRTALAARGVGWATVRLSIGLGTFAPVTVANVADHRMHAEACTVPEATVQAVERTRARGGRVIAVGTTVVRTLESHLDSTGRLRAGSTVTGLFITPGHRVTTVDGLLTNFHQPRSSLLVLLAAFTGGDHWRLAYRHALSGGYRFLSFGDCMLCWNGAVPG